MHHLFYQHPSMLPPDGHRKLSSKRNAHVNIFWRSDGFMDDISYLNNHVNDEQLDLLIELVGTRKSNVSDIYLRHLHGARVPIDRCIVRFSDRFSAMWVFHRGAMVWFSIVDDEFMVFALKRGERLSVAHDAHGHSFSVLYIPTQGVKWTKLQQLLVENFEDDDSVRAILAAAIVGCTSSGKYAGVANQLLPTEWRTSSMTVIYDMPVDEDMVAVLANAYEYDGRLFFKSGGGYVVESTMKNSIAVLRRTDSPLKLTPFEERHDLLMPFLFR